MKDFCSQIKRKFNSNQIPFLTQLFTVEEVEVALKQMGAIKALGINGLLMLFYQKY